MQAELARVYHEELIDVERATAAYKRLLELRPDDDAAAEALETDASKRERWRDLVDRYVAEAEGATDGAFKSALYTSAADIGYRYGRAELGAEGGRAHRARPSSSTRRTAAPPTSPRSSSPPRRDWDARRPRPVARQAARPQLKEDRIAAALRARRAPPRPSSSDPARADRGLRSRCSISRPASPTRSRSWPRRTPRRATGITSSRSTRTSSAAAA